MNGIELIRRKDSRLKKLSRVENDIPLFWKLNISELKAVSLILMTIITPISEIFSRTHKEARTALRINNSTHTHASLFEATHTD